MENRLTKQFVAACLRAGIYDGMRCEPGDQFYADMEAIGWDLSGTNLRCVNFKGKLLYNINLSFSNLFGADFSGPETKLDGTNFSCAFLGNAKFISTNCYGVIFSGARFMRTNFACADLLGAIGFEDAYPFCSTKLDPKGPLDLLETICLHNAWLNRAQEERLVSGYLSGMGGPLALVSRTGAILDIGVPSNCNVLIKIKKQA